MVVSSGRARARQGGLSQALRGLTHVIDFCIYCHRRPAIAGVARWAPWPAMIRLEPYDEPVQGIVAEESLYDVGSHSTNPCVLVVRRNFLQLFVPAGADTGIWA